MNKKSELVIREDGFAEFPHTKADTRYEFKNIKPLIEVVYFPYERKPEECLKAIENAIYSNNLKI